MHTPLPQEVSIFTWKLRTVLNRIKNQFLDFELRLIMFAIYSDRPDFSSVSPTKSGQILKKDAQWAATNEKSIFRFLRYDNFCTQNCQFSMNFHHNWKMKIGKICNMIFPIFRFWVMLKIHRNSLLFSLHWMPWLG